MNAAEASDGSTTESEGDDMFYVKSEENANTLTPLEPLGEALALAPTECVVKSEGVVVESTGTLHIDDDSLEVKSELPISYPLESIDHSESGQIEPPMGPCCSACGYPLILVPEAEITKDTCMLDCKCCLLVLPESSYSKKQRSETRKDYRKCSACTGNLLRGPPPMKPTRAKPRKPSLPQSSNAKKRSRSVSGVFTNKVGRLKMAKRALQRKRDETSKLKATPRREEYEKQLDKEELDLARQSVLLERENPSAFKSLMDELKIKKPLPDEQDRKKRKKTKATSFQKKRSKRKTDTAADQAKKKRKVPVVNSSIYGPPATAIGERPARVIPTRAKAKAPESAVQVKCEVKTEM